MEKRAVLVFKYSNYLPFQLFTIYLPRVIPDKNAELMDGQTTVIL